jgi:hypothetical protein
VGSSIGSAHVHGGRRQQGVHLGSDFEHNPFIIPDASAVIQGGRPNIKFIMVKFTEGVAVDLLPQSTANVKIMRLTVWLSFLVLSIYVEFIALDSV